jgi:GNAT superfamily N-acetyltransferase
MTIRPSTAADTPRLIAMAQRFLATTPYGALLNPDPDWLEALVDAVLENGTVLVAELDGVLIGMIALSAQPHILTGEFFCDEVCWWVEPEFRLGSVGEQLLTAAEDWARTRNLSMLKMVAPAGTHVGNFYISRGFFEVETSYLKRL